MVSKELVPARARGDGRDEDGYLFSHGRKWFIATVLTMVSLWLTKARMEEERLCDVGVSSMLKVEWEDARWGCRELMLADRLLFSAARLRPS